MSAPSRAQPTALAGAGIAGAAYFLIVFLIGFGLGTFRVLYVAARLGETGAVLLETPLMLAASWAACGWCLRRFDVRPSAGCLALMGGVGFTLLMASEFGLAVMLFGRAPAGFVAAYRTAAGAIGLAAQVAFGLMPLLLFERSQRAAPLSRRLEARHARHC